MRRSSIAFALATMFVLGLTAGPAMAAPRQPVGDRVDLRIGDQTFPASTPFHIDHGFLHETGERAIGLSDFVLDMDGTVLTADFVERAPALDSGVTFSELWFYNFPSGLTGAHTFTRHYFNACDNDAVPCDGNRINTPVEVLAVSATVTFAP
jgi:hypothetical protein